MNIETAIRLLTNLNESDTHHLPPDLHLALLLGITALRRHTIRASLSLGGLRAPLPGETNMASSPHPFVYNRKP